MTLATPLPAPTPARSSRWGLIGTLALGFATTMSVSSLMTGFGVLYPAMIRDQGWSVGEVSGAYSVSQLVYGPVAILAGLCLDRFGVRSTMLVGCVFVALGLFWMSSADVLWEVYLAWVLVAGVGTGAAGFVSMFKLLSLRMGSHFGLGLGVATTGPGMGMLVTATSLQYLVDQEGWRVASLALGAAFLLVMVPLIVWAAPGRVLVVAGAHAGMKLSRRWVLGQPAFWMVFGAGFCVGYLLLLQAHQVAHLLQVGFSTTTAAALDGVMGVFQSLGALAAGWLVGRIGVSRLQMLGSLMVTAGLLALIFATPTLLVLPLLYALVGATGRGAWTVSYMSVARIRFGGSSFGFVSGVLEIAVGVGSFAGAGLVGLLADRTGSYVPGLWTALVIAIATSAFIIAGITLPMRRARD